MSKNVTPAANRGAPGRPPTAARSSSEIAAGVKDLVDRMAQGRGKGKELSEKEIKKIKGFKKEFKKLAKQTGADTQEFRADQTQRAMYRAMIATVLDLIPIAHENYVTKQTETAFYCFRSAAEQLQQLMAGIRTLESLEEQAEHVNRKILTPALVNMINSMLAQQMSTKARIDTLDISPQDRKKIKDMMDESIRQTAAYITDMQRGLQESIMSYLVGD